MLSEKIKTKAMELDYIACGIIPADEFDEYAHELDRRSEIFPETKKLYDDFRGLSSPPEGCKSIIVCTQRINKFKVPGEFEPFYGKMYLFDNRISYTEDFRANKELEFYIKMLGLNILEGSVPARWAGARAGLGVFGRNNFLYDKKHGSYIIINIWFVDQVLDFDDMPEDTNLSACNDGCHKCIKACPTYALSDKLLMDARKCICYAQFDEAEALNVEMRELMDTWLYGCDACQDVCPMNKDKFNESAEYPLLSEFKELMRPESILDMDEDTYKNVLNPRFWYAGEESLWLWKCNALRVMINACDSKYYKAIKKSCESKDARISEMAKWGCNKLGI